MLAEAWLVREEMWKVICRMVLLLPRNRRHNARVALRHDRECRPGQEHRAPIRVLEKACPARRRGRPRATVAT